MASDRPLRLAVLTSGGDCSGMNAAVRAVVKTGISRYITDVSIPLVSRRRLVVNDFADSSTDQINIETDRGCEVFVVREGWEGLVRGNQDESTPAPTPGANVGRNPFDESITEEQHFVPTYGEGELLKDGEGEQTLRGRYIIQVGWDDMRGFLSAGGTLIGTARSEAFRTLEGRKQAVLNLVKHNIEALIVCGGDGSLTGADRLRAEWGEHMLALRKEEKVTEEQLNKNQRLNIVGLVGSIDNDMAGTDMTIGKCFIAVHLFRIIDARW